MPSPSVTLSICMVLQLIQAIKNGKMKLKQLMVDILCSNISRTYHCIFLSCIRDNKFFISSQDQVFFRVSARSYTSARKGILSNDGMPRG